MTCAHDQWGKSEHQVDEVSSDNYYQSVNDRLETIVSRVEHSDVHRFISKF